jgi:hypothetical protein
MDVRDVDVVAERHRLLALLAVMARRLDEAAQLAPHLAVEAREARKLALYVGGRLEQVPIVLPSRRVPAGGCRPMYRARSLRRPRHATRAHSRRGPPDDDPDEDDLPVDRLLVAVAA